MLKYTQQINNGEAIPMKFLFASDSFKGTLTSEQTVELLALAAKEVFGEIEYSGVPVADGGEGTTDAVVAAEKGQWIEAEVCGPLMEKVWARYGRLDAHRAVIEMAAASGLTLVPLDRRDPLKATSYGTGELIRHALDQGFTDISIAIGGKHFTVSWKRERLHKNTVYYDANGKAVKHNPGKTFIQVLRTERQSEIMA